jgi:hypothetical protein
MKKHDFPKRMAGRYRRAIGLLNREKRIVLFVCALVFVIGMQGLALSRKIPEVKTNLYRERAIDMKVTSEYRYGYSWSGYGAILVKTRNIEGAAPRTPGKYPSAPGCPAGEEYVSVLSSDEDRIEDETTEPLWVTMKRELDRIPWKFSLELALYLALLFYAFFGVPWLMNRRRFHNWGCVSQCSLMAVFWMMFWIMVSLPLTLFDYGHPIHANWEGPGGLSFTYVPFKLSTGSGLTISYRYAMDILSSYPLWLFTIGGRGFRDLSYAWESVLLSLGIWGCLFYGMGGAIYASIRMHRVLRRFLARVLWLTFLIVMFFVALFPPWRQPSWMRGLVFALIEGVMEILFPWLSFPSVPIS